MSINQLKINIIEFIKKWKINLILFAIVFIDVLFSIFTKYGIIQKVFPLFLFLICFGIACCRNPYNYKLLTRSKRIIQGFLMILICYAEVEIVNVALMGNVKQASRSFVILMLFIFTLLSLIICNLIYGIIYRKKKKEKIFELKRNYIFFILFIIFIVFNVFFFKGFF